LERPDVGWAVTKTHVLQIRINGFCQNANASIAPYARKDPMITAECHLLHCSFSSCEHSFLQIEVIRELSPSIATNQQTFAQVLDQSTLWNLDMMPTCS
jgi:hypothetical protein